MEVLVFSQPDGLQNNAYLLVSGNRALVIDPSFQERKIEILLKEKGISLVAILLTHAHFDHMGEGQALAARHQVSVHVSAQEKPLFAMGLLSKWRKYDPSERVDFFIDKPNVEDFDFSVTKMPGHSPGSVAYVFEKWIFTGDSVLQEQLGPTHLPLADPVVFKQSVLSFMSMDDELVIMPGHYGYGKKLKEVKATNPELLALLCDRGGPR